MLAIGYMRSPSPLPLPPLRRDALSAYQESLSYAPNNTIARQRSEFCKTRCERLGLN